MIRRNRIPAATVGLIFEWVAALAVVGTLIMNFIKLWKTHAQPQPFIFHINDVFADWFNTSQFAHLYGAYDVWKSIYPPISFVFLEIFSRDACYLDSGMNYIRVCDWVGKVTLTGSFFACIIMAWGAFRTIDRRTMWPRTIAFGCSLPLWYGLERGNLIMVFFVFMALANGPYRFRSAHIRWLCAGIAINFKPYAMAAVAADLVRKRWGAAEATAIWIVVIYAVTWLIFGSGDPVTVYKNITLFSSNNSGTGWGEIYYAAAYNALIGILRQNELVRYFFGSVTADTYAFWLESFVRFGQALILLTVIAAWFRPSIAPRWRLAGLMLSLASLSTVSGGYSMIIICYYAFLEPMRGPAKTVVVVGSYLLCLQADIMLVQISKIYQESYFFGGYAQQAYGIGLGAIIRPGIVLIIQMCICATTLQRFFRDRAEHPRLNVIARLPANGGRSGQVA